MATAEQTVEAVLDATNKRYLVEHGEAEDGSWAFDRYSDGFVVQHGTQTGNFNSLPAITLPVEMKNTNYFATCLPILNATSTYFYTANVKEKTQTTVQFFLSDARVFTMNWLVYG